MKRVGPVFALLMTLASLAAATVPTDPGVAARVVRIDVTYQDNNPFLPWQYAPPGVRAGYGIVLNHRQVLTTEHLVRNQTLVEVSRARSGEKIGVTVDIADPDMNLALLTLPPDTFAVAPLALSARPDVGDIVTVMQFDDAHSDEFSDGRVTQLAVTRLPDAPASVLTHRVLVDMQIDGEGAPVIKDNRLAGIIIAYQASTRIATMISLPPLERFLADAAEPPYRGPATAGISWRSLTDPAKRAYLGVSDQPGGIQLIATIPGSGADKVLQPLDVVVRWDGYALDNLGFYNDPELGRLEFSHMVKSHRSPGDTVTADIVRDGKPMSVAITLTGDLDPLALVPENITGEKPAYLVVGGFVIREMDAHYLRAHGSEWRASVDPRLLNFYLSGGQDDYAPGDRIVLLAAVIPDAINVDYHGYRNEVITHVNGEPIRNMNDVLRIANSSGPITRIRLMGMGIDLVLDAYDLYVANQRMAQRYRIPELRYERPVKEIP